MAPKVDTQPCILVMENMALSVSYWATTERKQAKIRLRLSLFGRVKMEWKAKPSFTLFMIIESNHVFKSYVRATARNIGYHFLCHDLGKSLATHIKLKQ